MSVHLSEEAVRLLGTREAARTGASTPARVINDVRLLLIALWLGAAVFFSAVVAPSAFATLRTFNVPHANEVAGAIVTRTLSVVNTGGFIIALLLLLSAFLLRYGQRRRAFLMEIISLALLLIATGAGQWVIATRLLALRVMMGRPIDEVAKDDPLRVAFDSLHGYSVSALAVGIIVGAVALLLIARRPRAGAGAASD